MLEWNGGAMVARAAGNSKAGTRHKDLRICGHCQSDVFLKLRTAAASRQARKERIMKFAHDFQTILGRNLVGELKNFVHRPFLLCTMEDMWPKFRPFFDDADFIPYFVHSVDERFC